MLGWCIMTFVDASLIPKGLRFVLCLFLKFGQEIVIRFLMLNF